MVIDVGLDAQAARAGARFEQGARHQRREARTAEQMGLKPGMAWHQLVAHGRAALPGEGRYFLDAADWQRLRRRRLRAAAGSDRGAAGLLGAVPADPAGLRLSQPGAP